MSIGCPIVCALFEEELDNILVPVLCGPRQRRPAVCVLQVTISPLRKERPSGILEPKI